jgi:hypothetical protein
LELDRIPFQLTEKQISKRNCTIHSDRDDWDETKQDTETKEAEKDTEE